MVIPLIVGLIAFIMIVMEWRKPGRDFPKVSGWWGRALLLNGLQVGVIVLAGYTWDRWFTTFHLVSIRSFGVTSGAVIGYLLITFVFYWWHRWRHDFDFLWRWFHQLHHSPKRLEVITAFYKHPFELIADSILSSFLLFVVLGLNLQAASYAILLSGLGELFYHWNVSTPYWVGFIFQRPESHCVHHQKDLHCYNYADLPLWDILFGTFHNPKRWEGECGLEGGEKKFVKMLKGKDIT